MTHRRLTAPELDELFARLTPDVVAALKAIQPAGYIDQLDAARDEAIGLMEHAEDKRVGFVPRTDVDLWIRLSAFDALITWIDGKGRTCMHAPHWRRPEPVFSCAWRPGLVVCTGCLHLLDAVGDMDKTCDRCGHLCAGVDVDDAIYTSTVFIGSLGFLFGTCTDCRPALGEEGVA